MAKAATFEQVADLFVKLSLQEHPSALHGYLAAMAVGGVQLKRAELAAHLQEVLGVDEDFDEEIQLFFYRWHQAVHQSLADQMMGFELVLPEEEYTLKARMNGLALWAGNFISGFGEFYQAKELDEDIAELLQDLAAIAQAALGDDVTDEDEEDWQTLAEHVRLTAVNLWLEFNEPKQKPETIVPNSVH